MSGSGPATGSYPMTFRLFDAASGGAQVGVALTQPVSVTGGLFTTQLDFGAGVFTGALQIDWWTVDSGGASSGGAFALSGTSGQPDAGVLQSAAGTLRLEGGFWAGAAPQSGTRIFVPLLRR